MAYEITRTFEIVPTATVNAHTVRVLQHELIANSSVLSASVVGDFEGAPAGLRVKVVMDTTQAEMAGSLARGAIRTAMRTAGLRERSFRVTSGSGREVER